MPTEDGDDEPFELSDRSRTVFRAMSEVGVAETPSEAVDTTLDWVIEWSEGLSGRLVTQLRENGYSLGATADLLGLNKFEAQDRARETDERVAAGPRSDTEVGQEVDAAAGAVDDPEETEKQSDGGWVLD